MFIIDWWNSLPIASQVFACVAVPATLVLLIQTVLLFFGFGEDMDAPDDAPDSLPDTDVGDGVFGEELPTEPHDAVGLDGLRIFTVRGIVAFFVTFGWLGVAMDASGVYLAVTIPVSIVAGFVMMVVLALIFRAVMKFRASGNKDNRNAVGCAGRVYLTVPPARSGEGKVQVMLQGTLVERNAVTDEKEPIPTGCEIVVVGTSGQSDLVIRRK